MRSGWDPDDVVAASNGDLPALAKLVSSFQDMAVATAYACLSDFHLAEDAAQEAFAGLPDLLPQIRDPDAFPGWFRQVVRTCAARQRRSRRPEDELRETTVAIDDPSSPMEVGERSLTVRRLVEALPPAERTVVALQYVGGLSQPKIAELLRLPLSTVKKRAHDARRRLRKDFEQMEQSMTTHRPSRNRRFSNTVLMFRAVKTGDRTVVARLLEADPLLVDAAERWEAATAIDAGLAPARDATPLIRAAENNDVPMVELLLEAGATVDGTCGCTTGETALWAAAVSGHVAALDTLLQHGADPNRASGRGVTPLHAAAMRRNDEAVRVLVAAGADPEATDVNGRTPADWTAITQKMAPQQQQALLTGIRVIDLFATLRPGGRVRVSGPIGVGVLVTLGEITRRLQLPTLWIGFPGPAVDAHIVTNTAAELGTADLVGTVLVDADEEHDRREQFAATVATLSHRSSEPTLLVIADAPGHHHDVEAALPYLSSSPGVSACIVVDVTPNGDPGAVSTDPYDTHIVLSRERYDQGILPAIEPILSWSRLPLDSQSESVLRQAREVLSRAPDDPARHELDRFLTQPFVVAQPFTAAPADAGQPLDALIEGLARIVAGSDDS
jgi:RNA polymerase sigma factor (sigma-70 family)